MTLENFGDMWYCPPGTGWGSETWRNRAEFSQALDAVAYNASEFVEMYKHAWEAPEQEEAGMREGSMDVDTDNQETNTAQEQPTNINYTIIDDKKEHCTLEDFH